MHSDRTLPDAVVLRQNLYCSMCQFTKTGDATLLPTLKTSTQTHPLYLLSLFDTYFVVFEAVFSSLCCGTIMGSFSNDLHLDRQWVYP